MPHESRGAGKFMILPEFEEALPDEARAQVAEVKADGNLSRHEKHDKIMTILDGLSEEDRARLPAPPLPPWVHHLDDGDRERFEAIHKDSSLGFRERRDKEKEFLESLPEEVREKMRRARSQSRGRMRGCWKRHQEQNQ
ncbi:unnamed protein product, partial [Mesorhabditis spiculigera]